MAEEITIEDGVVIESQTKETDIKEFLAQKNEELRQLIGQQIYLNKQTGLVQGKIGAIMLKLQKLVPPEEPIVPPVEPPVEPPIDQ